MISRHMVPYPTDHGTDKWCPIVIDKDKNPELWAVCSEDCPKPNDKENFLSYSIFLPIFAVLLLIIGFFVWQKKCKKAHSGSFFPKQVCITEDDTEMENGMAIRGNGLIKCPETSETEGYTKESHLFGKNFARRLEGDLTKINPNKSLNEQINVIPYNSKYEIEFSHFTINQVVGSGNFGTVYDGEAKIPFRPDENTKVAIKTVSQQSNQEQFSSLISEIKILSNLERHVNLVNMLGCCTSKLEDDGKLWLFLEFCNESDIKSYLIKHTKIFTSGIIQLI